MRYLALACDYDGTLASNERLSGAVITALQRLRSTGRRCILATGRTLEDLKRSCPELELFSAVVLENGAVVYWPATRELVELCQPVPPALTEHLKRQGVTPLTVGRRILATWRPREEQVLRGISELNLELQIVFNRQAVMVLPSGVNKATGLGWALGRLGLSFHEVVGMGSGDNDHSFLQACECSVAVASAVGSLRAAVDFTTRSAAEAGAVELIDELIADDLASRSPGGTGEALTLALLEDGSPVTFRAYGQNILISGRSGAGKSTFATGLIERFIERNFQLCIIDPEGDYGTLDQLVTLGTRSRAPLLEEVLDVLADPAMNVVVNLLGISLRERPDYFGQLVPRLLAMRARTGRPHWIVIDEVHHLFPAGWGLAGLTLPKVLGEAIFITHRPREVARSVLELADTLVVAGPLPELTLQEFATALDLAAPPLPSRPRQRGRDDVVIWQRSAAGELIEAKSVPARGERLRHLRKYAEGNLGHKSFIFRGPRGQLRLRAVNLASFCDLAAGVDEDTWRFHLHAGDYSRWLREAIKDDDLAREVADVEQTRGLTMAESVSRIRDAIDRRYILPA